MTRAAQAVQAVLAAFTVCAAQPVAAQAQLQPQRGEQVYARCLACHALEYDRVGPRHCGLLGRKAGSVPGYDYSAAMKSSNIIWDAAALDRFLAKPLALVPGSTMTYDGVPDAQERASLIAYLVQAGQSAPCRQVKR